MESIRQLALYVSSLFLLTFVLLTLSNVSSAHQSTQVTLDPAPSADLVQGYQVLAHEVLNNFLAPEEFKLTIELGALRAHRATKTESDEALDTLPVPDQFSENAVHRPHSLKINLALGMPVTSDKADLLKSFLKSKLQLDELKGDEIIITQSSAAESQAAVGPTELHSEPGPGTTNETTAMVASTEQESPRMAPSQEPNDPNNTPLFHSLPPEPAPISTWKKTATKTLFFLTGFIVLIFGFYEMQNRKQETLGQKKFLSALDRNRIPFFQKRELAKAIEQITAMAQQYPIIGSEVIERMATEGAQKMMLASMALGHTGWEKAEKLFPLVRAEPWKKMKQSYRKTKGSAALYQAGEFLKNEIEEAILQGPPTIDRGESDSETVSALQAGSGHRGWRGSLEFRRSH